METKQVKEHFLAAVHRFGKLKMQTAWGDCELSKGEFFCLGMIYRYTMTHPDSEGMGVSELAQQLRVQPPAASRMLRGLEKRGLVERTVSSEDRRNTCVRLSWVGSELWMRVSHRMDCFTDRVIERMGTEEMMQLVELLNRISQVIEEEQEKESC